MSSYCNSSNSVGVVGESNATTIEFSFPDYIEGVPISEFEKEFVWKHARDSGRTAIVNDRLKLNSNHTQCANLTFQVRLLHDNIEWKTIPKTFKLADTLALPDVDKPTAEEWQEFKAEIITILKSRFAAELSETTTVDEIAEALSDIDISETARTDLITTINERFETDIAEDATLADILNELDSLESGAVVKSSIIEMLNSAAHYWNEATAISFMYHAVPLTVLSDSMTSEQLETAINGNFQRMGTVAQHYLEAMQYLDETYLALTNNVQIGGTTDRNAAQIAYFVLQEVQTLIGLKSSIIDTFEDSGFSLDSASSPAEISAAIGTALADRTSVINAMYDLYTGGMTNA